MTRTDTRLLDALIEAEKQRVRGITMRIVFLGAFILSLFIMVSPSPREYEPKPFVKVTPITMPAPEPKGIIEIEIPPKVDPEERLIMAMTLYGEGRGEGRKGMIAIAHVIKNRAESGGLNGWPEDIVGVIYHPHAFSVWKPSDKGHRAMIEAFTTGCDTNIPLALEACEIANDVLSGAISSPFGEDLPVYYHATWLNWKYATAYQSIGDIGRHRFYLEDRVLP